MAGFIVLNTLTALILVAVALPLVRSDYWVFRVFEYPRFQKLLLSAALLVVWLFARPWETGWQLIFPGLLMVSVGFLAYKVFPYTTLSRKEMKAGNKGVPLKIFSGNVLQENDNYQEYASVIRKMDPDILFLLETDEKWDEGLSDLQANYPNTIKKVLGNTYGMIFCTRFKVLRSEICYLAENDVPSLDVLLELPSGQQVQLFGLHPKPPLPDENLRSTAKDKELMKIAIRARKCKLPVIVLGDLNDVAWSYITELFRKTSELLDPRRGRGFYSTFHAKRWFMRFPLDYLFASTHFTLRKMKRMPPAGSDHFPIYIELNFSDDNPHKQESPEADQEELNDAAEIAASPVTGDA